MTNKQSYLTWLRNGWHHFFFQPGKPVNLAISRILFFGILLAAYGNSYISNGDLVHLDRWADVPEYFMQPTSFFEWFGIKQVSYETVIILEWIFSFALFFGCIGFLTRFPSHFFFHFIYGECHKILKRSITRKTFR